MVYEFSQIIGNYSDQYKQQYINLINILFQDYKDLEFRNFNKNNLDNFFLFEKHLFTELSSTRKKYLNNISYYIKSMNSEKRNKFGHRRAYSSDKKILKIILKIF